MENFFQKKSLWTSYGLINLNSYKMQFHIEENKSTDIFLYSYCFYKSIFLNSEPIQITYIKIFDSVRSRWRASRRVRKRKKKKRERMSKVKHVKFCCSRCCNSSSHGDLIRGGLQSHSEKFISISRSKTRACRVLFLPPPSLSLLFTRGSHPLCPFRVLSSTGTESEQEERAFISSLLTAMRRKHGRIFFSRSLFFFSPLLFRRYLSFLYFHDFESQQ